MNKSELFDLFQRFQIEHDNALRNQIVEEFYPDIFDIAKENAPKLPENYEISDLFNAAVIAIMEKLSDVKANNSDEMIHEVFSIIDYAIQQEVALSIGPPSQTFISHDDAKKIQFEYQKNKDNNNKGDKDEKEKGI